MEKSSRELDQILTKDYLIENYINKNFSLYQIGKRVGCDGATIKQRLVKLGVKIRNMSEAKKGKKWTEEHKKNWANAIKGKKLSEETKLKMSLIAKQNGRGKYNKGKKSGNYKDGRTPLRVAFYSLLKYKNWRKQVFYRDNYICQLCGVKKNLEAHHIKALAIIFKEFLKIYNNLGPVKDKEILLRLAITYQPFWEVSNGKTLCYDCHDLKEKERRIKNEKI